MRKFVVAGAVALGAASLLLPSTANAAGTTVTVTVTAGALSISEPSAATLSLSGATYSGNLGFVQVTDDRGNLVATWTAKAAMTDFANGTETVPASNVAYTGGVASIVSGIIVPVAQIIPSMSTTPANACLGTVGVGKNAAKWNPSLSVAANLFAVSGSYTATLTHSVV